MFPNTDLVKVVLIKLRDQNSSHFEKINGIINELDIIKIHHNKVSILNSNNRLTKEDYENVDLLRHYCDECEMVTVELSQSGILCDLVKSIYAILTPLMERVKEYN